MDQAFERFRAPSWPFQKSLSMRINPGAKRLDTESKHIVTVGLAEQSAGSFFGNRVSEWSLADEVVQPAALPAEAEGGRGSEVPAPRGTASAER